MAQSFWDRLSLWLGRQLSAPGHCALLVGLLVVLVHDERMLLLVELVVCSMGQLA